MVIGEADGELSSYHKRADYAARRALVYLDEAKGARTPIEETRALERARAALNAAYGSVDAAMKLADCLFNEGSRKRRGG